MAKYTNKKTWANGDLIKAEFMNNIENQLEAITPAATNIATEYSSSEEYDSGSYVINDGVLYRSKEHIDKNTSWASNKWTQVLVTDDLSSTKVNSDIVNEALYTRIAYDLSNNFVDNKCIFLATSGSNTTPLTTTINIETPEDTSVHGYALIQCSKGDTFLLTARAGKQPRAYGFINTSKKIVGTVANADTTYTNLTISAPENGYLVFNYYIQEPHYLYKIYTGIESKTNEEAIFMENFAPEFQPLTHYYIGDYCTYRNALYQCVENTEIGAWDQRCWKFITIMDITNKIHKNDYIFSHGDELINLNEQEIIKGTINSNTPPTFNIGNGTNYTSYKIPCNPQFYSEVTITANDTYSSYISFVTADFPTIIASNTIVPLANGESGRRKVTKGTTASFLIPDNTAYIIIMKTSSSLVYAPQTVIIHTRIGSKINNFNTQLSQINNDINNGYQNLYSLLNEDNKIVKAINSNGTVIQGTDDDESGIRINTSYLIPIINYDIISIVANPNQNCIFNFLTSNTLTVGSTALLCVNTSQYICPKGQNITYSVPPTAKYICIGLRDSEGNTITPYEIYGAFKRLNRLYNYLSIATGQTFSKSWRSGYVYINSINNRPGNKQWEENEWTVNHSKNFVSADEIYYTYLPCQQGDYIRMFTASGSYAVRGMGCIVDSSGKILTSITKQGTSSDTYGEVCVVAPQNAAYVYMNCRYTVLPLDRAYLIVEKPNPIAPRTGKHATKAFSVNELFIMYNSLYKATSAIALDEEIIPGTNCVITTLAENLLMLKV